MAQKIVFSFDERSLKSLENVQGRGKFPTLATALSDSIQISEFLQDQAEEGFSEVVVRNPKTNKEKTITIPSLRRVGRSESRSTYSSAS